jgi:hypothetical protein
VNKGNDGPQACLGGIDGNPNQDLNAAVQLGSKNAFVYPALTQICEK